VKFSASNLAWDSNEEEDYFRCLVSNGFSGLEIAPTKFIGSNPYEESNRKRAVAKANLVKEKWGLSIASMQSIWFGRTEQIFGSRLERARLIDYSEKAFEFAASINCSHIVFGNPKNRRLPRGIVPDDAGDFFLVCADLAKEYQLTVGLEPIPKSYGNEFLTTFEDAKNFISSVGSPYIALNYDTGTLFANNENQAISLGFLNLASHIQISEPGLVPITKRLEFPKISDLLLQSSFSGWISIEMLDCGMKDFVSSLRTVKADFGLLDMDNSEDLI
jgi:sugar phosphate isomerase/epimerase